MSRRIAALGFMTITHDLRYSARQLLRYPGFAITAIVTLALGIGIATAVFSVAYGVLIDPFPYKDVHTLATPKLCWPEVGECGWRAYTPQQFNEIAQKTDIFSGVTASTIGYVELTGELRAATAARQLHHAQHLRCARRAAPAGPRHAGDRRPAWPRRSRSAQLSLLAGALRR